MWRNADDIAHHNPAPPRSFALPACVPLGTPGPLFHEIRDSIQTLDLAEPRPWLIGFGGGKDSPLVASLTRALADVAAAFKARYKLSLADAFAAALAKECKAELVTGDPEFKALAREIKIGWLK